MIIVAALIILLGVVATINAHVFREEFRKTGKHPKGHYMGFGIAIGMGIGVGVGVTIDIVVIGLILGIGIGVAIGIALERIYADDLREPTDVEKRMKKISASITFVLLALGAVVGMALNYLVAQ